MQSANPEADLALQISGAPDPVVVGTPVNFDITITNHGPDVALATQLIGDVTDNAGVLTVDSITSTGSSFGCVGTNIDCSLGNVDIDETVVVTVTATPTVPGTVLGRAKAGSEGTDPVLDPNPFNDEVELKVLAIAPGQHVFVVNDIGNVGDFDLADDICSISVGGPCTLFAAIQQANQTANDPAGPDIIAFDIAGLGPHTISLLGALPGIIDPVIIDGTTQPGFAGTPLIVLNGAGSSGHGLTVTTLNSTIRGLVIHGFQGNGIWLAAGSGGTRIAGNYIGVDVAGMGAVGNGLNGIRIDGGSSQNMVGGLSTADRNVISGNAVHGLSIQDSGSQQNVVQGNYIGTNAAGDTALANGAIGIVIVDGASGNCIGGTSTNIVNDPCASPFNGNVVSGNGTEGVVMARGANGNSVQGNLIGVDRTGLSLLGNGSNGVQMIEAVSGNIIGGTVVEARNVISGNGRNGVVLSDVDTTLNLVQGNYIGINTAGTGALSNGQLGLNLGSGVLLSDEAHHNTIGGSTPGMRNVISGNTSRHGVEIQRGAANNVVQGNFIGTDSSGANPLGNGRDGVRLTWDSAVPGPATTGNVIGGSAPLQANIIAANGDVGIDLVGPNTHSNVVQGNFIGTNAGGSLLLGNATQGVAIQDSAHDNLVNQNVIKQNGEEGIVLLANAGTGNQLTENQIESNGELGIDLGNNGPTPNDPGDGDTGPNALLNYPGPMAVVSQAPTTTTLGILLDSHAPGTYRVDVYDNTGVGCDPSGFGEGAVWLGSGSGPGGGVATVVVPGAVTGALLTATTTDAAGNTSEFSPCVGVNTAPTITTGNQSLDEGVLANIPITATDPDAGQTVTIQAGALPGGATFDGNTNILAWQPAPNQAGSYAVKLAADDGETMSTKVITLTVADTILDSDLDGFPDVATPPYPQDNCVDVYNIPTNGDVQDDFEGDGIGDLCDDIPIDDAFVKDPNGGDDPKVLTESNVLPPANGTEYQEAEPIFINATITLKRVDYLGADGQPGNDGIPDPYYAVRADSASVRLKVLDQAGEPVYENEIAEAPALHIPNGLVSMPGGDGPCPTGTNTVTTGEPAPFDTACTMSTVIELTQTRTGIAASALTVIPAYFNFIQDPERGADCQTEEEGCFSPIWMGVSEGEPTMVLLANNPAPPTIAPTVVVEPLLWDLTWEVDGAAGVVNVYLGDLPSPFSVEQIQASSVVLNGSVLPSAATLTSGIPGLSGDVLHLQYPQGAAMAGLSALESRVFAPSGDTGQLLITGILTADGQPGDEIAILRVRPQVALEDLSAPTIQHPASVTANATGPDGAVVDYTVTASDPFDPAPSLSCVPVTGSLFPIGTTTVDCTATDAQGNVSTASFPVMVQDEVTQIADLITKVEGLTLSPPVSNGLISKLDAALAHLDRGKLNPACRKLDDFINQVNAQTGKALTQTEAEDLLADAQRIQAVMGCG